MNTLTKKNNFGITSIPTFGTINPAETKKYPLIKCNFFPLGFLDQENEKIDDLINEIKEESLSCENELIDLLNEVKLLLCSIMCPDGRGGLNRLYFDNPKSLIRFLKDGQEK